MLLEGLPAVVRASVITAFTRSSEADVLISPSCAFKSECENSTLALLQRFVGFVLLELSELSSCAFSQLGNYFSRAVPVLMLLTSVSEKQRTNISTDRSGMAPKLGTEI